MKNNSSILYGFLWVLHVIFLQSYAHAQEPTRTWKDAAGKYSIDAKLIDLQTDSVRLQKTNGDTISVPLSKLSSEDQAYVKSIVDSKTTKATETVNPFETSDRIKIEAVQATFSLQTIKPSQDIQDLPDNGNIILLPKSTVCEPLTPDPATAIPNLKAGLSMLAATDPYDDLSELVTLNSKQALVAISIGRRVSGQPKPPSGKLLVGQLPKGPFTLVSCWIVKPTSKLAVVAKIGRGKPYTLQYSSSPIGGTGKDKQLENVNINPFTAVLEIRSGKNVLWTRNTENFAPPMIFLRGDETVQEAVKKYERPQPEFFSSLQIPPRIPKPEIARGLGSSREDNGVWVDFPRQPRP